MNSGPLSLIVCTRNRSASVDRLLDSLKRQITTPDETLIIDASSDRSTEEVVARHARDWLPGHLSYVAVPPEHRGLTRQRNFGIDRTSGDVVAFLDDDTVPAPDYFEKVMHCFSTHPEAGGVGGYISNEVGWRRPGPEPPEALVSFQWNGWVRREDFRWRLRRLLGLVSPLPPGWMPQSGHGRPVSFLPPDGTDYAVEFIMGGASAWRRSAIERHRFGEYFDGYGLYEDLDFCIRVSRTSPLFLCTQACLEHHHDPSARPHAFRYGTMVVRNGWYVWRQRWPTPTLGGRATWWTTTLLLTACRAADTLRGGRRLDAFREALGRCWGMVSLPTPPIETHR